MTILAVDATLHREGTTEFYVPTASLWNPQAPRGPAFFNPHAALNRDVSLALYQALLPSVPAELQVIDLLAGVGARAVRLANETTLSQPININDANSLAIQLARASCLRLGLGEQIKLTVAEAHELLGQTEEASAIDVDPFGSPAPFVGDALARLAPNGILAATATDTATLSGHYRHVAQERYGASGIRTEFARDTALRLLLGFFARLAISRRQMILPLFAHANRNYLRVYVRIRTAKPEAAPLPLGYVHYCMRCGHRQADSQRKTLCPSCNNLCETAGPLWLGALYDRTVVRDARSVATAHGFRAAARLFDDALTEDSHIPTYYTADDLAQRSRQPTASPARIIERLHQAGYAATRCALDAQAIRTRAPLREILRLTAPLQLAARP